MKIEHCSFLLLVPSYWLCLCTHVFVVSGNCLDDQKSLLLQFKNNITFTPKLTSKLNSWDASDDCCMWDGVTCDKEGYVTDLDLFDESISGGIDSLSCLFSLQHLQHLNLDMNNFTGAITSFGMPKNLTTLYLSDNNLSGIIPSSHFEGLHNLIKLDLDHNSFTGSIPSSLVTLPSLKYLWLSHNQFSHIDEFTNVSSPRLYFLDLSCNKLSGSIPSFLFTLPSLQYISLSNNLFSQLDELKDVSSVLNTLDFSNNNISGPFPTTFYQLSSLSVLRLSSNKLTGSVQLNKLFELKNLTELDLSHNNLLVNTKVSNVGPSSFPSIEILHLASCNLKTFPGFLRNLSTLYSLDLSDNQIQGILPIWIWKLKIQDLSISHNLLTDLEGPFENITCTMEHLNLCHNNLQGQIPVFQAEYLDFLDFSSNKLSSIIPREIGNYLNNTKFLSLSNNTLRGSIPDSICHFSTLQMLDLSMNNISGTIPSCLMMMSNTLQILNLKNNNLSGHIPDTVPAFCVLWNLNLHGNLLDGPIPKSLSYCSQLEVLDFGSNQIIGGFPCFLNEISTLRVLVLRNNKFQGPLSCSKANKTWEMLQIVDISFNNFSGKLLGKYFLSRTRNIMNNEDKDHPKLIRMLFRFSNDIYCQVSVIVVGKGVQMDLVKILKIFTLFDFSSNHFEGPIPEELMDFKELHFLNLSNNALSGEIPLSIGNLKQLESLDLSKNSLSGEIPMQLASLSFLSYLNLSFNHLVGKIPTGTQLQSFSASSFEGNDGLYGPPLTQNHDGNEPGPQLPLPECGRLYCTVHWKFISVELGLVFGHGIIFSPLLIWKRWRVWYWQLIHKILCWIFPRMYVEYVTQSGQTYATLRWQY